MERTIVVTGLESILIKENIDRYSRKIMWLKISSTNKDPMVILRYYLECVEDVAGVLLIIRGVVFDFVRMSTDSESGPWDRKL